jgi:hypothetical protein
MTQIGKGGVPRDAHEQPDVVKGVKASALRGRELLLEPLAAPRQYTTDELVEAELIGPRDLHHRVERRADRHLPG